jgi:hypothetical protein
MLRIWHLISPADGAQRFMKSDDQSLSVAMPAFRISIVIGLFILSNSISEARLSLAAEVLPLGLSTTALSSWPSLTYLSPKERIKPNLTGEEFGYFPRVETGPLVATVEDSPVAGTRAGYVTLARKENALHSGTGSTVLGDLYLADDHPTVAAEAAELLASTALLLDQKSALASHAGGLLR